MYTRAIISAILLASSGNTEEYVISRVAAEVANATETSIWQGASGADDYDGFQALCAGDGDVVDVAKTTVTATNVITEMGKVVDAASASVLGKEDLTLYVPNNEKSHQ